MAPSPFTPQELPALDHVPMPSMKIERPLLVFHGVKYPERPEIFGYLVRFFTAL